MRGFCVPVVEEYKRAKKSEKKAIVQGVIRRVQGLNPPGRFLKKNAEGVWEEIDDEKATRKVAAAMRESVPDKRVWEESGCESLSNNTMQQPPSCVGSMVGRQGNESVLVEAPGLCLLSTTAQQTSTTTTNSPAATRNVVMDQDSVNMAPSMSNDVTSAECKRLMTTIGEVREQTDVADSEDLVVDGPNEEQQEENLFRSIFGEDLLVGPVFTEEDCIREKGELTEEEKIAVLSDLFGDCCEISQPPKKKVAREGTAQPPPALPLLLEQMRYEIDAIPFEERESLVEAQEKSSSNEFSDDRLELFLVRESMNAKVRECFFGLLQYNIQYHCACSDVPASYPNTSFWFLSQLAARRFVNYWTRRRELFGPDKFHLPMTIDGALRDDADALEAGVFSIVPKHDASGRPILYYAPYRNTRDCSRDSLVSFAITRPSINLFVMLNL
jgi:hypothetical protein